MTNARVGTLDGLIAGLSADNKNTQEYAENGLTSSNARISSLEVKALTLEEDIDRTDDRLTAFTGETNDEFDDTEALIEAVKSELELGTAALTTSVNSRFTQVNNEIEEWDLFISSNNAEIRNTAQDLREEFDLLFNTTVTYINATDLRIEHLELEVVDLAASLPPQFAALNESIVMLNGTVYTHVEALNGRIDATEASVVVTNNRITEEITNLTTRVMVDELDLDRVEEKFDNSTLATNTVVAANKNITDLYAANNQLALATINATIANHGVRIVSIEGQLPVLRSDLHNNATAINATVAAYNVTTVGHVTRLDGRINTLNTTTIAEVARVDLRINEVNTTIHDYMPVADARLDVIEADIVGLLANDTSLQTQIDTNYDELKAMIESKERLANMIYNETRYGEPKCFAEYRSAVDILVSGVDILEFNTAGAASFDTEEEVDYDGHMYKLLYFGDGTEPDGSKSGIKITFPENYDAVHLMIDVEHPCHLITSDLAGTASTTTSWVFTDQDYWGFSPSGAIPKYSEQYVTSVVIPVLDQAHLNASRQLLMYAGEHNECRIIDLCFVQNKNGHAANYPAAYYHYNVDGYVHVPSADVLSESYIVSTDFNLPVDFKVPVVANGKSKIVYMVIDNTFDFSLYSTFVNDVAVEFRRDLDNVFSRFYNAEAMYTYLGVKVDLSVVDATDITLKLRLYSSSISDMRILEIGSHDSDIL